MSCLIAFLVEIYILIQSWITPTSAFRHQIFLGLYLPDCISNIFGLFCMSTNHYLHHSETLNQSLPLLRKLFYLSGCIKYWRRSPSMSCCSAAPFIESGESLRVTPEALCVGICWEQAYQSSHKDRNQLCQKDGICFLAQP